MGTFYTHSHWKICCFEWTTTTLPSPCSVAIYSQSIDQTTLCNRCSCESGTCFVDPYWPSFDCSTDSMDRSINQSINQSPLWSNPYWLTPFGKIFHVNHSAWSASNHKSSLSKFTFSPILRQARILFHILYRGKISMDLISIEKERFTSSHLIDNTIIATVWVTHGFHCSNHETWVRHAFSSSILTIGKKFCQQLLTRWVIFAVSFNVFHRRHCGELMRFVARFAAHPLLLLLLFLLIMESGHLSTRERGLQLRISPLYGSAVVLSCTLHNKFIARTRKTIHKSWTLKSVTFCFY